MSLGTSQHQDNAYPNSSSVTATHPDSELIAACQQFDMLERQIIVFLENLPEAESERKTQALVKEQKRLVTQISKHKAVTLEGHAARAHSLYLAGGSAFASNDPNDLLSRLFLSLLRDMTSGSPS